MITVHLLPYSEKRAKENPHDLEPRPLYHQMCTANALQKCDVVMNTYNTGTGKTIASLLHLFALNGTGQNVLFIAPTNALLEQHAEDIEEFVKTNNLNFAVRRVTAAAVRKLQPGERPGKVLHHLIRNYLEFEEGATRRKPLIIVVNPDIFYYATFARYGPHDQRNLLEDFLLQFNYIVIDEFHYYDNKQLANFLFVLALFDQFGYFELKGRKVCLLSATPTPHVRTYLDRLFGDRWQLVSPHNEPADADTLDTIPSLAPLTLTLIGEELTDWIAGNKTMLAGWLDDELDGAVISSSLWRVNYARTLLRGTVDDEQMKRITGPETAESRRVATVYPLILASPTVDIGYNFAKKEKKRQNIDFLVCDARYRDDLLQRIGRAGRVLGKEVTDQPVQAIALLPADAIQELADLDGQTISRSAFNERIRNSAALPGKHNLTRYIDTHAITESFHPIFKLGSVMPVGMHDELEALFDRVCQVFAPSRQYSYGRMKCFFFKYNSRKKWLRQTSDHDIQATRQTAEQVADWLEWQDSDQGKPDVGQIEAHLAQMLSDPGIRRELRQFVQSQVTITEALFSFRDSFQGPQAVVYDPRHLLSSERVNTYDLFHLLRHYQLSPSLSRRQFRQHCGEMDLKGDFYFEIRGWREEKLSIEFNYHTEDPLDTFEKRWCHRPIGLSGLQIRVRQPGGDIIHGGIDPQIASALEGQFLPVLMVTPDAARVAYGRLHHSGIWSRRLTVTFPDGTQDDRYSIFVGTSAFFAHAELKTHFWLREKMKSEAIIL